MSATLDLRHPSVPRPSRLRRAWQGWRRGARSPARNGFGVLVDLPRSRILRIPGATGQRIECLEGCIWVTMDEDQRDVIIVAGQSFTADRSQLVLVQALDRSRLRLVDPAA